MLGEHINKKIVQYSERVCDADVSDGPVPGNVPAQGGQRSSSSSSSLPSRSRRRALPGVPSDGLVFLGRHCSGNTNRISLVRFKGGW